MYKYENTCLLLFEESPIKELSVWHGLCVGKDLPGQQANEGRQENNGSIPGQVLPLGQPHRSVKISCDSSVAFSANTK